MEIPPLPESTTEQVFTQLKELQSLIKEESSSRQLCKTPIIHPYTLSNSC